MRSHGADQGEPGRLLRAWRWLRSSGQYSGYEADHQAEPEPEQDADAKARLATAALTQHIFWPPR